LAQHSKHLLAKTLDRVAAQHSEHLLAKTLDGIGAVSRESRATVKANGFKYYELNLPVLEFTTCYRFQMIPEKAMLVGIQADFTLKDDKITKPEMYLGPAVSKMSSDNDKWC
jgi:hypothetical protein